MKVLFCIPYISNFNMVKYYFRFIKNIMYKRLYPSINSMKDDLINIINGNNTITILPKLYKETLGKYLFFISENINKNLNN